MRRLKVQKVKSTKNIKYKKYKVAITGNIAAGKSSVGDLLLCILKQRLKQKLEQKLKVTLLKSDEIAHSILASENKVTKEILERFGKEILVSNKSQQETFIDRSKLGKIVFSREKALRELEELIHPEIENVFRQKVEETKADLILYEIPLLFESGKERDFEFICTVFCEDKVRLKRFKKRAVNLSNSQIHNRFNSQLSQLEKISGAQFIVNNSLTWEDTQRQTEALAGLIFKLFFVT